MLANEKLNQIINSPIQLFYNPQYINFIVLFDFSGGSINNLLNI
jgi:hypothetical protein